VLFLILFKSIFEIYSRIVPKTKYRAQRSEEFNKLIAVHSINHHYNIIYIIFNCLFFSCSKRIVNISKTEDDVHLVHREMANGKHTKSVQVDFEQFRSTPQL